VVLAELYDRGNEDRRLAKLQARDRAQLVIAAYETNLVPVGRA
jgi:hypothetical protein